MHKIKLFMLLVLVTIMSDMHGAHTKIAENRDKRARETLESLNRIVKAYVTNRKASLDGGFFSLSNWTIDEIDDAHSYEYHEIGQYDTEHRATVSHVIPYTFGLLKTQPTNRPVKIFAICSTVPALLKIDGLEWAKRDISKAEKTLRVLLGTRLVTTKISTFLATTDKRKLIAAATMIVSLAQLTIMAYYKLRPKKHQKKTPPTAPLETPQDPAPPGNPKIRKSNSNRLTSDRSAHPYNFLKALVTSKTLGARLKASPRLV